MKRIRHHQAAQPVPHPRNLAPRRGNTCTKVMGGIWNAIKKAKRWVFQNPGKALIWGLLISTGGVILKLMNQNNTSSAVVPVNFEGQLLQVASQPTCPVIVFYEVHSDKAPAEMMTKLFPNLVASGYKTFLFEEPTGSSLTENIRTWESQYAQITSRFAGLYEGITLHIRTYLDSLKTSLNLLKRIKKEGLNYEAMDLDTKTREELEAQLGPHSEEIIRRRDDHMAMRIQQSCVQHGGGQVVLVGVYHSGIEQRLQRAGYANVSSTYIIDHPPITDPTNPPGREDNDIQLRTKNLLYMQQYGYGNTNVINVYDNRNTNVRREVLSGLRRRTPIKEVNYS